MSSRPRHGWCGWYGWCRWCGWYGCSLRLGQGAGDRVALNSFLQKAWGVGQDPGRGLVAHNGNEGLGSGQRLSEGLEEL